MSCVSLSINDMLKTPISNNLVVELHVPVGGEFVISSMGSAA